MNTLQIIKNINQTVINKDCFNIIKDYVDNMDYRLETYSNSRLKFKNVIKDLEYFIDLFNIKSNEQKIKGKNVILKKNYGSKLINRMEEEKEIRRMEWDDFLWEQSNLELNFGDCYEDDECLMFNGEWFDGGIDI